MGRIKDTLYDDRYNGYMSLPVTREKLPLDSPVFEMESLLSMLAYPGISINYEQEIMKDIDELSEKELAKEKINGTCPNNIIYDEAPEDREILGLRDTLKLLKEDRKEDKKTVSLDDKIRIALTATLLIGLIFFSFIANAYESNVWCRVTDFNTQCIYFNLQACQMDAAVNGGICLPKQSN